MTVSFDGSLLETIYASGDLPLLGHVVMWRAESAELAHSDFAALLTTHGFDKFAPPVASYRNALRDALTEWLEQQGRTRETRTGTKATKSRVEVINNWKDDLLVFVVVGHEADFTQHALRHETELRVFLSKSKGDIFVTLTAHGNGAGQQLAQTTQALQAQEALILAQLGALYTKHRTMLSSLDVSRCMASIIESLQAVSLRGNGGVYFVPDAHRPALDRLRQLGQDVTAKVEGELFLLASPVVKLDATRKQFAHVAHRAFEAELAALEYELGRVCNQKAGTVGASTVARHIDLFKQLRTKADAYGDLLGMRQESIAAAVERLQAQAKTIVLRDTLADDDDAADTTDTGQDAGGADARPLAPAACAA